MAYTIKLSVGLVENHLTAQPLTQEVFAAFGDVVGNPRPETHPSQFQHQAASLPPNAASANQGSAIRYGDVSRIRNLYEQSPSGRSSPVMSVFVCAARPLGPSQDLTVRLLERHPFTTQTFSPLASTASRYLVIVAPSLQPGRVDRHLPVPEGRGLPGRGMPDVRRLRAFVASSSQAVTYGAGTWHAPMVVLGPEATTLDFVVSQFSSGVAIEDCQLVELSSDNGSDPQLTVKVPSQQVVGKL